MPNVTIYNSLGDKLALFSTVGFNSAIKIGRSSECQICLKGVVDTSISRVHLILSPTAFGWRIRNNGQTGMYKDCMKVEEAELKEGDVYRFGALFLAYGAGAGPSAFDLVWNAMTENRQNKAVLWPGRNSVGASRDNYACIRTEDISRIHAFMRVAGNHVFLRSATMSNSCLVNDIEVTDDEVEIHPNDTIRLADTDITLVRAVRVSFQNAAVEVNVRSDNASIAASTHNQVFMYAVIALFTALVVLVMFFFFRML